MLFAVHGRRGETHISFHLCFWPFPRFFRGLDVQYLYRLMYPYRFAASHFSSRDLLRSYFFPRFGRFPTDCHAAVFQPRRSRPLPGSGNRRDRSVPRTRLGGVVRLPRDPCLAHHSRRRPRAGEMGGTVPLRESFWSLSCDNGLAKSWR